MRQAMGAGCHRVRAASRARSDGEYRIANERQSVLDERPRNYSARLVLDRSSDASTASRRGASRRTTRSMRVSARGNICTAGLPPLDHSTHIYEILNPKDCCTSESQVLLYDLRYVRYEGLLLEALAVDGRSRAPTGRTRAWRSTFARRWRATRGWDGGSADPDRVLAHVLPDARSAIREAIGPSWS